MAHHSTVFAELLKLLPRHEFRKLAKEHDGARRSDAMSRWTQFVALATAQLCGRNSLRDIESTVASQSRSLYHLGAGQIKRTTLGRANKQLSYRFYEALFSKLYSRCQRLSPGHKFKFKHKLFSLDSTLLDVSLKVFPSAEYNRMKAAYKLHVALDHDGLIPAFAAVTPGKTGDQTQAKLLNFRKGSVLVFDRGYNDYKWHNQLTDKGIFWVARIRGNAKYRIVRRDKVNKGQGITSDQLIEYNSHRSMGNNLRSVRRIGYRDSETGKHYVFITNHLDWSAKTVAEIYKQRWQVELFFKWIKQNLKIKAFIGNSENAVMTQVFTALCIYLLLAFIKFSNGFSQSLQQISRLLHVNLFAKRPLGELFRPPPDRQKSVPQMRLAL